MTISGNAALPGSYDYLEVALSILIAICASYAALDLAGRVAAASGWRRWVWLSGGATAMGIGIMVWFLFAVVSSLAAVALAGCGSIHVKPSTPAGSSTILGGNSMYATRTD